MGTPEIDNGITFFFRCPVCVKTFVLLGNLKRHMLNHELDAIKMETPVSRVFNDSGNTDML